MSTEGITMSVKPQTNNAIYENLKSAHQTQTDQSVAWLAQLRASSWARFLEIGIPNTRHEEWKYFNLSSLSSLVTKVMDPQNKVDAQSLHDVIDLSDINIVFVNGHLSTTLSSFKNLPKGLTIATLSSIWESNSGELKEVFNRSSVNDPEPFVSLNTSLFRDGVYVKIDDKVIIERVIHIIHVTTTGVSNSAVFPRSVLTAGQSSQASILETFIGLTDEAYFINPVTDIRVGANAVLNYYKSQADGKNAFHIGSVRVTQEASSQLEAFSLAVGARMARNNISVASNGEGTDSILDGLYILGSQQEVDNHTLIDHRQPNCTSHQLYKGILNDASHAVFNGKIFVQSIAQKTNSYQLNKHLLLGKEARVDTKPQLEIFADDVKCTHGATIGQLNEDEIFYFQTRCISKEDAIRMLSRGFVDDLLDKLKDQNVRQKLNRLLSRKIALLQS